MSTASLEKAWFASTVDLFVNLEKDSAIEEDWFLQKVTHLITPILNALSLKIERERLDRFANAAFIDLSRVSNKERIQTLVISDLFKLIFRSQVFLKDKAQVEIRKERMLAQFQDYDQLQQIDFTNITKDKSVLNWLFVAHEILEEADDNNKLKQLIDKIPSEYYQMTQTTRSEIKKIITTKDICHQVISMLMKEKSEEKATEHNVQRATAIYRTYQALIILPANNQEVQDAIVGYLIESLKLHAKYLTK